MEQSHRQITHAAIHHSFNVNGFLRYATVTWRRVSRKIVMHIFAGFFQSAPGTVIEITLFDSVTQPWLFTFFDYIKVSLDGNFTRFHRYGNNIHGFYKTPEIYIKDTFN